MVLHPSKRRKARKTYAGSIPAYVLELFIRVICKLLYIVCVFIPCAVMGDLLHSKQ